jgi:von Willebrand factor type A domain/Aerotolerance regulator N-terminal
MPSARGGSRLKIGYRTAVPFVTKALLASGAKTAAFELLAPGGLFLLALLVPLVVLYILKIKRSRRRVASTWLWAAAQRDLMAKAPFKRLVAQVPLLVQAAALLALALAFARPATRGREMTGDHVAFIVDTSASMSALVEGAEDPGTTRLDLAKRTARDMVASLAPGSDALVLEAGREARLLSPLDRDRVRVRAAIDRIGPRDVEGDLGAAVALAVDRLRQLGGARRIVVITDGNLARPGALSGAALPLEVVTVGTPVDNAAIVRVDVRSGVDPALGKEQVQGFLVVANFGRRPRDLYVTMREDQASDVLASRRVAVGPGERVPVELGFYPSPGDYRKGLIFELSPHDAMPVDDVAYARVPAGDKLPVYLAGASPWLERALASDPMVDLHAVTVAELARGAPIDLDAFVVVDGACPESPPGGDLLIVHPLPGRCLGAVVGPPAEHPEITSWDRADARMRFLTLDGVHVARGNLIDPEGAAQRLVNTREGTLVADVSTSARTATLVGFDVGDSDWPLKASFVLFVRNLLEQARTHRAHGVTGPARTGEPLRVSLPRDAEQVEAVGPDGQKIDVSHRGGLAILPDVARAGFYRVSWQGKEAGSALVPANLTSAAESDLSTRPLPVEPGKVTVSASAPPDAHHEWTWLLALGALALVVFDVWYLTRDPRAGSPVATPAVPRPRLPERKRA